MRALAAGLVIYAILALSAAPVGAKPQAGRSYPSAPPLLEGELLPTGQRITPSAAAGAVFSRLNPNLKAMPDFTAGQAASLALSPDGRTLLILTSGFNRNFGEDGKPISDLSREYVFIYDVSGPAPVKLQVLTPQNTFEGLAWAPDGDRFYVSGGVDDAVLEYVRGAQGFQAGRTIKLGHAEGLGLRAKPHVAGLAVSPDGQRLLAANYQNDSVSLIDLASGTVIAEQDLRPGKMDPAQAGRPGGTFPRALIWASNTKAYVASQRDREIIALSMTENRIKVGDRLATKGQPGPMTLNRAADRLYVALDNTDGVAVVDTRRDSLLEQALEVAPAGLLSRKVKLGGAGTNHLALSPNERTLFVSDGGLNALGVLALGDRALGEAVRLKAERSGIEGAEESHVVGLIPTGWYPTGVAVSRDGARLYAVNGKTLPGPNPLGCRNTLNAGGEDKGPCRATGQYVWQLQKAGFLTLPTPTARQLHRLTRQVAHNNGFEDRAGALKDAAVMGFLHRHIRHVIYVVKENRSYDQVLGDLGRGNGDPKLTLLGEALSPNHHALARQFVTLDAFLDSGESSNTGWNWTTAARTNDFTERAAPINYAGRGLEYDQEGANRNVNVGLATQAARIAANPFTPKDPDVLAGARDVAAPDGPNAAEGRGYLWDAALRAGVSVRNYGFYGDLTRYYLPPPFATPLEREPFKTGTQVFVASKAALIPVTDPYYRGFDQAFPDYWRFKEWRREFNGYAAMRSLPALSLVRLPHDHFGSFDKAIDGVNTVETEMADNDYALALLIETVAKSVYAKTTLIFVVEDDAQDGADHVDAHRSMAFLIGPYVRRGVVVSEPYNTVAMIKTIENVLGLEPMGLTDSLARPMTAVFDIRQAPGWTYQPIVPDVLRTTKLPLPAPVVKTAQACAIASHTAAYWSDAMAGQDFSVEDHLDVAKFNAALWAGLKTEGALACRRATGEARMRPKDGRTVGQ